MPLGVQIRGKVKTWVEERGFGFLEPEMGGPEVFVHRTFITDALFLEVGADVYFTAELDEKTWRYRATKCSTLPGAVDGKGEQSKVQDKAAPAKKAAPPPADSTPPSAKIVVSGLPKSLSEESVRELLSTHGQVAECAILPAGTRPDRLALVEMEIV